MFQIEYFGVKGNTPYSVSAGILGYEKIEEAWCEYQMAALLPVTLFHRPSVHESKMADHSSLVPPNYPFAKKQSLIYENKDYLRK